MKQKKPLTVKDIEQFVIDAGSDHVGTFGGKFEGGIQCQQVPDEIAPCILAILESGKEIKSYLEIGVAAGGTTFLMNHFFKPKNIVLIDDNKHPKAHVRPYVLRDIKRHEVIGQSQSVSTIDALKMMEFKFDLILIDGDHSYYGVKMDVENYMPLLTDGGFLVMHDSALSNWGVKTVVDEMKYYDNLEFINEYIGNGPVCGVALFRKVVNEGDK